MNSNVALVFGGLIVLTLAGCSDDTRGADGEPGASPLAEYLGSVARLDYDSGTISTGVQRGTPF